MSVIEERIWEIAALVVALLALSVSLLRPVGIGRIRSFLNRPVTMSVVDLLGWMVVLTFAVWSLFAIVFHVGLLSHVIGFGFVSLTLGILRILARR